MWATVANKVTQEARKSLEEELEYSTVTNMRQEFLPMIERLQKNPALRLLILKHGTPQAVLMSYPTYEALKRLVKLIVQSSEAMSGTARTEAAFERLRSERSSASAEAGTTEASAAVACDQDPKAILLHLQASMEQTQSMVRALSSVLEQYGPVGLSQVHIKQRQPVLQRLQSKP